MFKQVDNQINLLVQNFQDLGIVYKYKLMKKLQLIFDQRFNAVHRIGLSEHSEVYLAYRNADDKEIAIKVENADLPVSRLERQAKIYRVLKGGVGIPNMYWYGIQHNYRALVIDIYGPSLQQLLKFCNGKFTLKTTLMIMDQLIDRIKWIHEKKFVYNDISPENFLVGLSEKADKIFVVDFDSCSKYTDGEGNHIQFQDQTQSLLCSQKFNSIHGHIGKRKSRRDDLESLGYMLVYFLKGNLPWEVVQQQEVVTRDILVKEKKVGIPVQLLCQDLPHEFVDYLNYVKALQFQQQPDYVWIKRLFKDLFEKLGYKENLVFDWAEKHKY